MSTSPQETYNRIYDARVDRDRPKPIMELHQLLRLAREATENPGRLIEWQLAATPDNVLDAVAADTWDRNNPYYSCIVCHDGKDLPEGYECRECGADNPRPGSW